MIMKSLFEIGNNSFEFLLKFDKQRRKADLTNQTTHDFAEQEQAE